MARTKKPSAPQPTVMDEKRVATAVAEGLALIGQGNTKIDAAMAIYRLLEDHFQETLVKAFVDGATLTERAPATH